MRRTVKFVLLAQYKAHFLKSITLCYDFNKDLLTKNELLCNGNIHLSFFSIF